MTEMDIREETSVELAPIEPTALMLWAMDAQEAYKVAISLVKTSFVPQTLRGKPEEAAAAILTGQEIGLSPMAALRSIDIIQGTPAMRAHALRGLVQSRGHEVWVEAASPTGAVVKGRRKGEQQVQESRWDIERAKGLKLLDKPNWKSQPQAMFVARATSELCRLVASDVLLGLPYSIEELDDAEPEPTVAVKRTVKRQQAPTVEAPPLDDLTPPEPAQDTQEPSTEPPLTEWPEVAKPADADE
jgi:hypothetical protein